MKKTLLMLLVSGISSSILAVPTTYESVYKDSKASRHEDLYRHRYPQYPSQRYPQPHVAVQTPHVSIYMPLPQTQYREERTEEVYLPYGGTYRKTTEYISPYPQYNQGIPVRPNIIREGHYYSEED